MAIVRMAGDHALGYGVCLDVEVHEDELPQRGEGYMDILLALLELRVADEGDDEVHPPSSKTVR